MDECSFCENDLLGAEVQYNVCSGFTSKSKPSHLDLLPQLKSRLYQFSVFLQLLYFFETQLSLAPNMGQFTKIYG